jgi:hypothetical protein
MTDTPKDHFVLPNDAALGIHIGRVQWEALNKFTSDFPEADKFRQFRDFSLHMDSNPRFWGLGGVGSCGDGNEIDER